MSSGHEESRDEKGSDRNVAMVVFGASGDLAKRKTYPALYHLHAKKLICKDVLVVGYARTKMNADEFGAYMRDDVLKKSDGFEEFLSRCCYVSGNYDKPDELLQIDKEVRTRLQLEPEAAYDRIYYLALPPVMYEPVLKALHDSGINKKGSTRVIIEKPFGHDLESSCRMNSNLLRMYQESQLYRIDHYLGKEMVLNMIVLRFANSVFEPIWNNRYISNVKITLKEDFGTQGRAGYFDKYGIIRDVMQNHLMQIFALIAMESPVSLSAEDVRDEKVKLLRCCPPISMDDLVVGQYGTDATGKVVPYLKEEGVAQDSITPTFAAAIIRINNPRWSGVPFIVKCGKGLNERKTEVRIQFKQVGSHLFKDVAPNELVFIIQPKEAIYLKMMSKVPGFKNELVQSELNLSYDQRYGNGDQPDAYERLILDAFKTEHNLFVRTDELEASWSIYTPVLHYLQANRVKPTIYEFGTRGPKESDYLAYRYGWERHEGYCWPQYKSV
ncbi:glucose-6-phosphate 1-dehydrogenase-like isoform X2 [Schistocerca gregaria]|nr:glucose-6-phosphate 1-dehydrogenase-like isoform X2 [Schistocerca gregaria]XP_049848790.1 glucose-6-phosphate 1-dehydrogenase-like isoform X2 [Schistocerca gregaria]